MRRAVLPARVQSWLHSAARLAAPSAAKPQAVCLLQDPAKYREIYNFAYLFSRCGSAALALPGLLLAVPPPEGQHSSCRLPSAAGSRRREKGQKCVQLDIAVAMWKLLVDQDRWRYVDDWCDFLQKHHKRAVSRDTWNQVRRAARRPPLRCARRAGSA